MAKVTQHGSELTNLRRLAAVIGRNSRLVQGAGGNVSLKADNIMWIKASGTWLADAEVRDIMVPVVIPANADGEHAVTDWDISGLRPSIETSLHDAIRRRVVLHVHSVDAIALAVRTDAADLLVERLDGLRWALIPYERPGLPLTRAVLNAVPDGDIDVLVLANHGLVVAAEDVCSAAQRLADVVARLSCDVRPEPPGDSRIDAIARSIGYVAPQGRRCHAIALDGISCEIAEAGVLYPDHIVFLGIAPLAVSENDDLESALKQFEAAHGGKPQWVLVRGVGVALAPDAPRGAAEMLRCLADVAARIPCGAPLNFLGTADIAALTGWEAEKYRRQENMAVS